MEEGNKCKSNKEVFQNNSTSYYYSSLFFPSEVKEDVFKLYAYVRTADDFVDDMPQQPENLREFRDKTFENWDEGSSGDRIVDQFIELARRKNFEREWVESFLDSMELDLEKQEYESMEETLDYIHGSAEVIGLMMCRILELDREAERSAKMLGRAMQYCNFIRDIKEDQGLGRRYLPTEEMEKYGLETLNEGEYDRKNFNEFIRGQIKLYREWQKEAETGFGYIPYRTRVPVILSSRLYKWTARKIEEDPEIVQREEVRPSKFRIALELLKAFRGRT